MRDPTREEMLNVLKKYFMYEDEEWQAEEAIYWFSANYHGGQGSNLYSALSRSCFEPSKLSRGPDDELAKVFYQYLVNEFANT